MKSIHKEASLEQLDEFQAKFEGPWVPKSWGLLPEATKPKLKAALLEEQGGVCCYCEIHLDLAGSDSHIEHLEARSQKPKRMFDYWNLLASCNSLLQEMDDSHELSLSSIGKHCGGRRKAKPLPIHPLLPDCGRFFDFTENGGVVPDTGLSPEEKRQTREVLETLLLNHPFLQKVRRSAITATLMSLPPPDSVSVEFLLERITDLSYKGADKRFFAFRSAIEADLRRRLQMIQAPTAQEHLP